jgi:hypothetical protein
MSKQPKPLQLADECMESANCWANEIDTRLKAAAELRRLHAVNQELLEAAKLVEAMLRGAALNANKATEKLLRAIEKAEAV